MSTLGTISGRDRLIAGDFPIDTKSITLISGQNLTRGTLLGKITASGKYTKSLAASSDGSQTPEAILAEACDASAGDKKTTIYQTGQFNQNAVIFGTGHTAATTAAGLRNKSIFLKTAIRV